jgi:hypothetical protein
MLDSVYWQIVTDGWGQSIGITFENQASTFKMGPILSRNVGTYLKINAALHPIIAKTAAEA